MVTTFDFIGYDPNVKKPGKSLQIRSRCMQGKNKREGSRRSKQELKKASKKEESVSCKAQQQQQQLIASGRENLIEPSTSSIDRTLVTFDLLTIDPSEKDLILRACTRDILDHSLSHLDVCVNFEGVETSTYEWLLTSDLFLQSTLCAAYAFSDFTNPQWNGNASHKTLLHQSSTLRLLQTRLYDEDAYQDDSLVHIIASLALLGGVFGDWLAGANHFMGLRKIIQLRGDALFLSERPKLHLLLDRIDLARSLTQGTKPLLLQPVVSWSPILPAPPQSDSRSELYQPPPDWDSRLASTFLDFQRLSCTISRNAHSSFRYSASRFQDIVASLQSRLLALSHLANDPTQQLVVLTLLSLLTPMINVPGPNAPFFWVLEQFRTAYGKAAEGLGRQGALQVWVLLTVALMHDGACEDWVVRAWHRVGSGLEWAAVRQRLVSVVWIGVIHDRLGQAAFRKLSGSV